MKKLIALLTPTRIANKLIRHIALVALISLILSFGLSYALFWPQLRADAHDTAASASRVIMQSINDTVKNLDGYAQYMTSSDLLAAALAEYSIAPTQDNLLQIQNVLSSLKSISSNMRTVVLIGANSEYFQSGVLGKQDFELLNSTWFYDSMTTPNEHSWSSFYISDVEEPEDTLVRISPCVIGDQNYALSIFYNADSLMDSIESLAQSTYTGYLLTDRHDGIVGVPFYESGDIGNAAKIAASYTGEDPYSTSDAKGHYFLITIPANGWRLVGFIDRATFNASLLPFIWLMFLICLILGLLIVLLFLPAVNRILSPIRDLGNAMKNVSRNGPDFYSPVQTDDEIGELSDIFNDMLDEIRINSQRELEQQTREQQLTYNLMVAQINSHFFYNTLSVINSLARHGRNDDVIRANAALTTIFQDCLRPQSIITGDTVAHEKSIVECYWVIECLDPANKSSLEWDIPENLTEQRIPKNIIQPLVENALFHGLDNVNTGEKNGRILVSLRQEDSILHLQVRNNGHPIRPEILNRLNHPTSEPCNDNHIGLANIRRRLNILYGEQATLFIRSDDETIVTIEMPNIL